MIDTGISSSKVSQKNTWFLRSTRDMGQSTGLNLKDVIRHLPRWDASLWGVNASPGAPMKARQMAEVRNLQLQLHSVHGRRTSLPLSSMSEVLGIKTVLPAANQSGKALPSNTTQQTSKGELRTHATRTPVSTVRNSVKARNRVFLDNKEVIKLSLINGPTNVIKSLLNISQNIFVLVMPRACLACLEDRPQYGVKLPWIIFHFSSLRMVFLVSMKTLFGTRLTKPARVSLVLRATEVSWGPVATSLCL